MSKISFAFTSINCRNLIGSYVTHSTRTKCRLSNDLVWDFKTLGLKFSEKKVHVFENGPTGTSIDTLIGSLHWELISSVVASHLALPT